MVSGGVAELCYTDGMKNTTLIYILVGVVLLLGLFFILYSQSYSNLKESSSDITVNEEVEGEITKTPPLTTGKLKADTFKGKLEEVNTGCFADGECFVAVNGKHITTLLGRKSGEVGSVVGVEGFGDLENFIGEEVEVYAQDLSDGTFTLYGSEGFYIKLLDIDTIAIGLKKTATLLGLKITPLEVLEDSRCPVDVVCIQAGTVRVKTALETDLGTSSQIFKLGEKVATEVGEVTLIKVYPEPESGKGAESTSYIFYFQIKKR